MKKFLIEMEIITQQKVVYEVEAESKEKLEKDLEMWSPSDMGECVEEQSPEYHHEEITEIREKKQRIFRKEKKQ